MDQEKAVEVGVGYYCAECNTLFDTGEEYNDHYCSEDACDYSEEDLEQMWEASRQEARFDLWHENS